MIVLHTSMEIINIIITDSESMIRKLDGMNEYPGAARSMVMDADFDVLSALHKQLNWGIQSPGRQHR